MRNVIRLAAVLAAIAPAMAQTLEGTLYKDPTCPCCEGHARYLGAHGVRLKIEPTDQLREVSQGAGIPSLSRRLRDRGARFHQRH
jgi:hypothetical protein